MTTQAELIAAVAKDAGVSQADAGKVLTSIVENIHKSLKSGGDVRISNLGVFDTAERAEREGRNPATGATIKIAASKAARKAAGADHEAQPKKAGKKGKVEIVGSKSARGTSMGGSTDPKTRAAAGLNPVAGLDVSLEDAAKLTSTTLTVPVKSGAEGRLFGTVRAGDIASAVETAGLGSIDKRRVDLTQRIKTTGVYQAVIHLHEDVNANVEFEVVPA